MNSMPKVVHIELSVREITVLRDGDCHHIHYIQIFLEWPKYLKLKMATVLGGGTL